MTWQEYQEIIGQMYENANGVGTVQKNITRPDRITGHSRQIDVWIDIEVKGHLIGILIDAKFHADKVDVKDVEEVLSLAEAVGAHKSILVCTNGWTAPAKTKAGFSGLDLRIVTIEDAIEILEPDKWKLCPICENDCVIMDCDGAIEYDGIWFWWIAGQCRECRSAIAWCQDCGEKIVIPFSKSLLCQCGHLWKTNSDGMSLRLFDLETDIAISKK